MPDLQKNQTPRTPGEFSAGRFALSLVLTVAMGVLAVWRFTDGATLWGVIGAALCAWNAVVTKQEWSKRR